MDVTAKARLLALMEANLAAGAVEAASKLVQEGLVAMDDHDKAERIIRQALGVLVHDHDGRVAAGADHDEVRMVYPRG